MPPLVPVTTATFDAVVLQAPRPVVVEFGATWCAPCTIIAPVLDALAAEYAGRASFVALDVDREPALTARYGVRGLPTLLFFTHGEVAAQLVGVQTKATIAHALDTLLG